MNQRPLGYEGRFAHDSSRDQRSQTNGDKALANNVVGAFWIISVAVLHRRFIGFDRRSRPNAEGCACCVIVALARCGVDSLRAVRTCSSQALRLPRVPVTIMKAWAPGRGSSPARSRSQRSAPSSGSRGRARPGIRPRAAAHARYRGVSRSAPHGRSTPRWVRCSRARSRARAGSPGAADRGPRSSGAGRPE